MTLSAPSGMDLPSPGKIPRVVCLAVAGWILTVVTRPEFDTFSAHC